MSTSDAIAAASGISNRRTGKTINQIFKATYSNVPVFEYVCRGVAVMRRRSDSYVNATHILKVANFNKPQRTRILETEIQTGQHEKIQGGYGKYQGTWVPLSRAAEVAKQFGVEEELRPLFDFIPTSVSPPPAPKHITAATVRPKKSSVASLHAASVKANTTAPDSTPTTKPVPLVGPKILKRARVKIPAALPAPQTVANGTSSPAGTPSTATPKQTDSISPPSSGDKTSGRRKRGSQATEPSTEKQVNSISPPSSGGKRERGKKSAAPKKTTARKSSTKKASTNGKGKRAKVIDMPVAYEISSLHDNDMSADVDIQYDSDDSFEFDRREAENLSNYDRSTFEAARSLSTRDHGRFASVLFTYFTSTLTQIPQILLTPPPSLDVNLVIDDDGNTPLHWATATARLKVSRHIVDNLRADVNRANAAGQTPLMRAVQFPDNHEERTFPILLDLLQPSLLHVDRKGQSVLHHIVISASYVRTSDVACYYMRSVLDLVAAFRNEFGRLLNLVDVYGETALDIARRVGSDRLPMLLIEAGASRPHLAMDDSEDSDDTDDDGMDLDMVVPVKPETGAMPPTAGIFHDDDSQLGASHSQAKRKIVPIWKKFTEDARAAFALRRQEQEDRLEDVHSLLQSVKEEAESNKRTLSEYQDATAQLPSVLEQAAERERRLMREMLFNQTLKMRKEMSVVEDSSPNSVARNREERLAELKRLRMRVKELEEGREELTGTLAALKGKANQGKKYQNLIAACCNVPLSEVGSVIEEMLESV